MLINIFVEYIDAFDKINICLTFEKPHRGFGLTIEKPNQLLVTHSSNENDGKNWKSQSLVYINLIDLDMLPLTCSNLKFDPSQNTMEMGLKAFTKHSQKDQQKCSPLKYAQEILKNSSQLKCNICRGNLINTRSINQVLDLPLLSLLGSQNEDYFCHSHEDSNSTDWKPPPPTCALTNGKEIVMNSILYNRQNLKQGIDDLICCSRCCNILGKAIQIHGDNIYCFTTSRLLAEVEEKDIDGDFIQNIDVPIIEKRSTYFSFLIRQLIEEHSFRVIINSCSSESSQEFMLLWLFDKISCIYSTSLELDMDTLSGSGDSVQSETCSVSPNFCHSLLYQICFDDDNQVLSDWKRDMSIRHIELAEDECEELARILISSTSNLPKLQRMANNFYRGEIPVA